MLRLLYSLNFLPIFDTEKWPKRELLSKLFGVAAVVTVLARMVYINQDYVLNYLFKGSTCFAPIFRWVTGPGSLDKIEFGYYDLRIVTFAISICIYLAYIISFLTRSDSKNTPRGFMEVVFPFIIAALPFAFGMFKWTIEAWCPEEFTLFSIRMTKFHALVVITSVMGLGSLINLIGLLTLRRAFTIMTDARVLITRGPFRFVRHPLYLGHFLEFFAIMLLSLNWITASLYVVFVIGQYIRARNEERKLCEVFPEYPEYREKTGMFLPKLLPRRKPKQEDSIHA